MSLEKQLQLFSRVDHLIKRKATGDTETLAKRLNISTRSVFRIIKEMREELEADIEYCPHAQSYIYKTKFSFKEKILEKI
ncbi:MAG: hypothetical protein AAF849_12240 [Bacteroidota bacterium]